MLATVASAGLRDVPRVVDAARRALDAWQQMGFVERRRVLLAAADDLESRSEEIRTTMALETGAVAGWSAMNTAEAAATLREAAGLTSLAYGEVLPAHDSGSTHLSLRGPAGVVLAIVPWNAPLVLAARSVAIALATGNTVILRPSEESPWSAGHVLAESLARSGAPAGVVNVLTTAPGTGREIIAELVAQPAVRRVVFIGSTPVGRQIARLTGENLVPAVMELGGKNPTIVLDDVDLEVAARTLVHAAFTNTGQVCMATDRIIVAQRIFDELTDRVLARTAELTVGDPRCSTTDLGPLIHSRAATTYRELVADAVARGATLLAGSGGTAGLHADPVVLTGLPRAARLYTEEAFSPIVSLSPAVDEADAIRQANDTEYGLIASVLSADPHHGWRVAEQIQAGAVHVNGSSIGDEPHVPFGGVGLSGFGRLGGLESVRTFTEQRTFSLHGLQLGAPLRKF